MFFSGWREISEFALLLETTPPFNDRTEYNVHLLHSGIPSKDQRKVFVKPSYGVRKIVLSTSEWYPVLVYFCRELCLLITIATFYRYCRNVSNYWRCSFRHRHRTGEREELWPSFKDKHTSRFVDQSGISKTTKGESWAVQGRWASCDHNTPIYTCYFVVSPRILLQGYAFTCFHVGDTELCGLSLKASS